MKISAKDMWAAAILIGVGLFGLYLNGGLFGIGLEQHNLGTPRRMGPGYMPMLVLWMQVGLGALVLLIALNSGPDPMEGWTRSNFIILIGACIAGIVTWRVLAAVGITESYREVGFACLVGLLTLSISPDWRPMGTPLASYAIFGLMLEPLGLMAAIAGLCVVSAFADREHTVKSVIGMTVALCVLCWVVFIWQLDIRVPLWPTIF
ncbi:tripartite tricarboxylate transporter TctB family protein [Roseomonas sp. CCTCC AB2023176]|uniref:tripartite tricarboxylate transporter TctB family protein n=1 Tax=Roseomonas sp. CCTCC AB2023176 TaxID=3342640 RepID=UPI0035DC38BC